MNKNKAKEYLLRKDEILECLKSNGRNYTEASVALGIPVSTLRGLYHRWADNNSGHHSLEYVPKITGVLSGSEIIENSKPLYIFVDQALEQPSIEEARAFWAGVKAAKGL